jgi:hypothetical protein
MGFNLTQTVGSAHERAANRKPREQTINRDAYPVISPDFPAPGGVTRIVARNSTGAEMLEYEPEVGKVQRIALAAVPAVGFVALSDEHRQALADLFPEFGDGEAQESESN